MKTTVLTLIFLGLFFLSCEKKSNDPANTDSVAAINHEQIKTTESVTFLRSLNKSDILTKFFKPYKISHDTAFWKQDLESIDMKVSSDGFLHTVIDSIYKIENRILILFTTYDITEEGQINSCHPCNVDYSIANLVKQGDHYEIKSFKKHLTNKGSMGQGAYVTIAEFTNGLTALKFEDGWIGGGTIMTAAEYFNTEDFSSLIYLETQNSNEGMCDETDFKCINKTEREIIPFDKHPSNKPAIIINYKHTYYDKKLIIIEKSDTLVYDGYYFKKDVYYKGV